MGDFFGSIYCYLFEDFFGPELANYLWGQASPLSPQNQFGTIGLTMTVISLTMVLTFYYIVNQPRLNNVAGWGLFLVLNAIINLVVGRQWVMDDFSRGLMCSVNPANGVETPLPIDGGVITCFGVSNMLLSMVAFVLFSYMFKWWSSQCSRAPF
mgnify:CR=1 FL=1|jgi:hypothetical protein